MTTSPASEPTHPAWPTLEGRQEPEHLLCDDGDQTEADKAVVLATRVKRSQMPWQENTLRAILALDRGTGLFTHPTSVVIAPRQNGKTLSAAELRTVFGIFHRSEHVVYTAQRWKTAEAIYRRVDALIRSRPSLNNRVVRRPCSQGVASIELASGAFVFFLTRSPDLGRGLTEIDVIIHDESYNLKDGEISNLNPMQLASRNAQTIYLSSAVNQVIHANGQMLSNLRHKALQAISAGLKDTGIYFAEYMAPLPPADISRDERERLRDDPAMHRLANPSYGVIHNETKVRKLQIELTPQGFEAEVLGWGDWPEPDGALKTVFTAEQWRDRTDMVPKLLRPAAQTIGVHRDARTKVWSIAGAIYTADGGAHIEIGWAGLASHTAVVEKLVQIVTAADPVAVVIDTRSPAAILKPHLITAGIEPVMTNAGELALACGGVTEAVRSGQITHSGQVVLADSAAACAERELPGGQTVFVELPGSSIVHLFAATLAHWALLTFAAVPKRVAAPVGGSDQPETDHYTRDSSELDVLNAAF